MGPLLVGAAGLMWGGHVADAGPGSGGGLGASRLLPAGTLGWGPIQGELFYQK